MELWQAVKGYEGIYEVSNKGNVRTVEGKVTHSEIHGKRIWKSRVLKQKTDRDGYKRVTLYKDKKPKTWLVHRLVAISFLEKVEGKEIVNHKDTNPANNEVSNLEWSNYYENLIHAFKNKLNQSPNEIKLIHKESGKEEVFYSMAEASRHIGRSHGYISALIKRGIEETDGYEIKVSKK